MGWIYLLAACVFEVTWAIAMKYSEGFTRFWPTAITLVATLLSFGLMAQAVRTMPVGTGYTVLNAVGIAGTVLLGVVLLGEPSSPLRLFCVGLILAGVVGLRMSERQGNAAAGAATAVANLEDDDAYTSSRGASETGGAAEA